MTVLLTQASTLYQGIQQGSELTNKTVSNSRFGLLSLPGFKHAYFFHRPSCSATNPAIEQIGWFGLMTLCGMVRMFTGPHWQPTEIGSMSNRLPNACIGEYFPNTRIKLSQPFSYIALEKELLKLPPIPDKDAASESKPIVYRDIQNNFAGSLEQVMPAYFQSNKLNIDFVAELCNTSKRTLQRKFRVEGTCFKKLLDRILLDIATQKLQNPGMPVAEISRQLGYSEVSNFIRALPPRYRDHTA